MCPRPALFVIASGQRARAVNPCKLHVLCCFSKCSAAIQADGGGVTAAATEGAEAEEAEYAWLQADSLKPFTSRASTGNPDGVLSGDATLQACVAAADRALQVSMPWLLPHVHTAAE